MKNCRRFPSRVRTGNAALFKQGGILMCHPKIVFLLWFVYFCLANVVSGQTKVVGYLGGRNATYQRGLDLVRQGEFKEARAMLEKALRAYPSNPDLHELLGDAYTHLQIYERAIEAYTSAIRSEPRRFS